MGIFDKTFGTLGKGLGDVIGAVARKVKYASWEGARSPYGLPIPIAYGVTWVTPIQVYSGEQFTWYSGDSGGAAAMVVPVYTVDDNTGEVSIEEKGQTCQSAVLVLCESAIDVLDILKDGVSINSGHLDNADITTVTQRLRMISGRIPNPDGIIPPTGEANGYFHGGTGAATAHTRFSRTANLGAAPYTYSDVARVDLCALGIGGIGQRPSLKFLVQGELATSSTVGAHPADVLMDLWERAGKDPADLNVDTYYRAYVTGGGGSGSTAWRVNRTIDTQTPARELMQSLLDETFSTVVKLEDGTLLVVPRDVAAGTATAIGVNDFVDKPPVTVEFRQASDCFNCVPVDYEVTTASGTHSVRNEDTTFANANPFSGTETIRRAPPLSTTWVSTAEHALNLSLLLGRESFKVRATYKFRLHKRWVLLQEHDLLSLTEPHLGLSAKVVKIRRISEGADGVISIEADEWFGQVAYTTPEVDPTDGFDGTLPGIPAGPTGTEGPPGADGATSYLHIKYSNDGGSTFTANNGDTPGTWLGQYVDFNPTASSSVSAYTWKKIEGPTGPTGATGTRGSRTFYLDCGNQSLPTNTSGYCTTAVINGGGTAVQANDVSVLYSTTYSTPYAKTYAYLSGTWTEVAMVVDGNLIVHGTVGADALEANIIKTSDYASSGTGADEVASRGAKLRNNAATDAGGGTEIPAIVCSAAGIKIGSKTVSESWLGQGALAAGYLNRTAGGTMSIAGGIGIGTGTPSVDAYGTVSVPTGRANATIVVLGNGQQSGNVALVAAAGSATTDSSGIAQFAMLNSSGALVTNLNATSWWVSFVIVISGSSF